ncbi:hypothetical protein MY519_07570 [Haemophilus influenzae]
MEKWFGKSTLRSFNQDVVQIVIDSDHIAMQINPQNPRLADIDAGRKAIGLFRFAIKLHIDFLWNQRFRAIQLFRE